MELAERVEFLEKRIQSLEEQLQAASSLKSTKEIQTSNRLDFLKTVGILADKLGLIEKPQFFTGAMVLGAVEMQNLFEGSNAPLVKLFENPPQVRENGFNFYSVAQRSQIVDGEIRQASFGSQIRRLSRDGRFAAMFLGGDDFLGWAMRQGIWTASPEGGNSPWRINSLSLIEATYESVALSKQLLEFSIPKATHLQFFMGYKNLLWNGKGPLLLKGKADMTMHHRPLVVSEAGDALSSIVAPTTESAGRTSLRLIEGIYNLFGLSNDEIPYSVVTESEGRVVDPSTF